MSARWHGLLVPILVLVPSSEAGPGFGGSCFQKDILNLVYLCHHFGLPEVADYWESVVTLNTWQQHRISRLVVQKLFGTVTGKRLAVLGFAFKANTNDTREAPTIRICRDLLEEGAQLAIHDPKVDSETMARDSGFHPAKCLIPVLGHPKSVLAEGGLVEIM